MGVIKKSRLTVHFRFLYGHAAEHINQSREKDKFPRCKGSYLRLLASPSCIKMYAVFRSLHGMQYLYSRSRFVNKVDPMEFYVSQQLVRSQTVFRPRINVRLLQNKTIFPVKLLHLFFFHKYTQLTF